MSKPDSKTANRRPEKSCQVGSKCEADRAASPGSGGTTSPTNSNPDPNPTTPSKPRPGEIAAPDLTKNLKSITPIMSNSYVVHDQTSAPQLSESLVIDHSRLVETQTRIMSLIRNPCGTSLVFLFGARAAGKTVLVQRLLREHDEPYRALIAKAPSLVPSCEVQVPPSDNGGENWREVQIGTLVALNELHLDNNATHLGSPHHIGRLLAMALKKRKTGLLIYDEAQHFTEATGFRGGRLQLEYIQLIARLSGTIILLAGTYELLKLLPRSGQLARGIQPVHLARYRGDDPNDRQTFRELILTFQQALPMPAKPPLVDQVEFLYRGSLGCVGLLTCWLNRGLALAIKSKSRHMTVEHLIETMLPRRTLERAEQGIQEGERMAADYE